MEGDGVQANRAVRLPYGGANKGKQGVVGCSRDLQTFRA